MKQLTTIFLTCVTFALLSCNKDFAPGTPVCIRKDVKMNGSNRNIGSVDEYSFQSKLVYAFSPDITIIADGSTEIKDESCKSLCTVGGFGGQQVNLCNGDNFFKTAVLIRNIWKKK